MIGLKPCFPKPSCDGRECYIDNTASRNTKKAHGRVIYPGARYCVYGKKVRRFTGSDAKFSAPRWCPKLRMNPIIRVYERVPDVLIYMLQRDFDEAWEPLVDAGHYVLRSTADTAYTPAQFYKKLASGLCDYMDLVGYHPGKYAVVEIDNGLTPFFLYLNKELEWLKISSRSFEKDKCDDGSVGGFKVQPHENRKTGRFFHDTEEYKQGCIGYMRGYFAEGRFQSHWQDNRHDLAGPGMWQECETLVEALKKDGFLRDNEKMFDYCLKFPKGAFPDRAHGYGYIVDTEAHSFYIRCLPAAEDYNVFLYVYACVSKTPMA